MPKLVLTPLKFEDVDPPEESKRLMFTSLLHLGEKQFINSYLLGQCWKMLKSVAKILQIHAISKSLRAECMTHAAAVAARFWNLCKKTHASSKPLSPQRKSHIPKTHF